MKSKRQKAEEQRSRETSRLPVRGTQTGITQSERPPAPLSPGRLERLERQLLQATRPDPEAVQLPAGFFARLMRRVSTCQQAQAAKWPFWEFVWGFSKPFAVVALALLILVGGLNLYTFSRQQSQPPSLESSLIEPGDMDLILSEDQALTQERVLRTLVVVREDDHENR